MAKKRSKATRRAQAETAAARAAAIRKEQDRKERRRRSLAVTGAAVVVLVVIFAIFFAVQSNRDTSGTSATNPSGTVAGGYAVPAGPSSAPVKVTVYEDFICPFCEQFESASRSEFAKDISAGKVQFQYHVLNFLDRNSTTQYSSRAANALGVVLDTSGPTAAKRFHDLLYENQPKEGSAGLSDAQLIDYAVQAGASKSKVSKPIEDMRYKKWVANVTDRASKAGVTGTPTVMIDGKQVGGATTGDQIANIQKAIDAG